MHSELIARLEAATGPSRELDKAILLALGYSWRGMAYWSRDDSHTWEGSTNFTASIDAALTLVPDGASWDVRWKSGDKNASVTFYPPGDDPDDYFHVWEAATPALAICIAALRAKGAE